MASRSALTSSFVRPVLTLCGWSSASQPGDGGLVALVDEQPLVAVVVLEGRRASRAARRPLVRTIVNRPLQLLAVEAELELALVDALRPSSVGASGSQVPQSQTITSPAPYCLAG